MENQTTETNGNLSSSSVEEKLDELGKDFLSEKEDEIPKKKDGRGRKSKAQIAEEEAVKEAEQIFSGLGSLLMSMIVTRLPNPSELSSEERHNIDLTFSRVASKYASIFGSYQEEFALATVLTMIILPRTNILESFNKKNVEEKISDEE
jgi:hypothetical protein